MKMYVVFPSPYGVTVIKSYYVEFDYSEHGGFPSPYGVTVIKSICYQEKVTKLPVSVPLWGNGN